MKKKSNRRFRPEFERFFQWVEHSTHPCNKCKIGRDGFRGPGNVFVQKVDPVPSIEGTDAHRVYFTCDTCAHMTFVGYTQPVDFNLNLGQPKMLDDMPGFDAPDSAWEDWGDQQQKESEFIDPTKLNSKLILTPY